MMSALPSRADERRGDSDVRFVPRLCENSDVELARRKFVSITSNNKRTALAVTVERRKERKQACAFSARARVHTPWVNRVTSTMRRALPVFPDQRTFLGSIGMSGHLEPINIGPSPTGMRYIVCHRPCK